MRERGAGGKQGGDFKVGFSRCSVWKIVGGSGLQGSLYVGEGLIQVLAEVSGAIRCPNAKYPDAYAVAGAAIDAVRQEISESAELIRGAQEMADYRSVSEADP